MGAPVSPGEIVKGKYRIGRLLGEGGMGTVVAAHHLALDQPVAIKFLQASMLEHPQIVERFAREARAASKIQSDHVARVTDVDALDSGIPFMVMEYLDGTDLSVVRREGKTLPIHVAVGYLLEACDAIAEAHRLGIVHRDLKPANLFLARRPDGRTRVKVLDFGISKVAGAGGASEPSVTKTTAVMGSAEYMSPEQMLSTRDADARSDIWALGVTLYEILTGRVPFAGESILAVGALVMTTTAPPASSARADVPPGLDAVVARCLTRDRAARYASVAELVEALTPFAAPRGSQDRISLATTPLGATRPSQPAQPPTTSPSRTAILDEQTARLPEPREPAARTGTRVSGAAGAFGPTTTGVVSSEAVPQPPRSSPVRWVAAMAAIVACGVGFFVWPRTSAEAPPRSAATATEQPRDAAAPASAPTAVPAPGAGDSTPPSAASAPLVAPASDDVAGDAAAVSAPARPEKAARPVMPGRATPSARRKPAPTATQAAAAPPPADRCSPPYTVDASGIKTPKPGCR